MSIPAVEGAILLTSSSRLARWLQYQYGELQKKEGSKCWSTPEIFSLTNWLATIWRQSWPNLHILSHLQSTKLWETIIQGDLHLSKPNLLHLRGTAVRAAEAYKFIQQYQLSTEPSIFRWTHESETFHRWLKQFENRLNEWRALDLASLPDLVKEGIQTKRIPLPECRLIFAGFDEITPQLLSLLEFLQSNNVVVEYWPQAISKQSAKENIGNQKVEVREYQDRQEESIQCARWVRVNQGKTVGVVDSNKYGNLLKRELAAELAPQSIFPWLEKELPFSFSTSASLAKEPMVQLALSILSTPKDPVPFSTFSVILETPFLKGTQSEATARKALDAKLRRKNMDTIYLNSLDSLIKQDSSPRLKLLLLAWKKMISNTQRHPTSSWAHFFSSFLRQIGWLTGSTSLNQRATQTYQAWTECLDTLASLDRTMGNLTRVSAAALLEQLATEKPFYVKTHEQPIQVVGLKESSGMIFDHLWVMGCNADILPAIPSPNPFIPCVLQKNLPHSSSDWELKFAEQALRRLLGSSSNIIFSFSRWDEKKELQMSPLLKGFPQAKPGFEILTSHRILDQLQPQAKLEIFQDEPNIAFTISEQNQLNQKVPRYGYNVLKNQAQCPFRSFARHRLHLEKLTTPETTIDSEEGLKRGNLLHNALEIFWTNIKNRTQLQQLKKENRLVQTINNCASKAIEKTFDYSTLNAQPFFIKLEFERVTSLIKNWLELELARPDFEVILKEKSESIMIGDLQLYIRIDRMDKMTANQLILIDYKTGYCNQKDWFQKRIQEPQLPLYAMKFFPDAISYASVQKEKNKFGWKTIARDPLALKDGKTISDTQATECVDWQEQMDCWKENLAALAEEFLAGKLSVSPFKRPDTCRNCELGALCRIGELDEGIFDPKETD